MGVRKITAFQRVNGVTGYFTQRQIRKEGTGVGGCVVSVKLACWETKRRLRSLKADVRTYRTVCWLFLVLPYPSQSCSLLPAVEYPL